jgi:hypothetical protein
MSDDSRKSAPPNPQAAQLGQELIAKLQTDFAVHKPTQLGHDLLAQFEKDFGAQKRADDAQKANDFAQALLGKVARDFGSVRPGAAPGAPPVVVPPQAAPITLAPPPTEEDLEAEAKLKAAEAAPLGKDDEDDVKAMSGGGAFGFFKKLLGG